MAGATYSYARNEKNSKIFPLSRIILSLILVCLSLYVVSGYGKSLGLR